MNIEKIIDENLEVMFWDIYNSRKGIFTKSIK